MLLWPVDVIIRPERLVSVSAADGGRGWIGSAVEGIRVTVAYFLNLLLYAAPLTLAGFGVGDGATAPDALAPTLAAVAGDADAAWAFTVSLSTNSAFLLAGTLLTFATFHIGVLLSGSSKGILISLRAVAYSTGVYLALMYTLVWYVATTPRTATAGDLLLWMQAAFFYYFIDFFDAGLTLPGGRPDAVDASGLSGTEQGILILLALSAVYYFYVLYAGARIGHGAGRIQALIATGFVLIAPVLYVVGTILLSLYT